MPERNRPPEDEQPLARPVQDQRLARPVGGEERETRRTQEEREEVRQAEEGAQREEKGLVDKAAEIIDEVGDKLTDRQSVHFEASVEIERPVEEVFGYVTVPENLPEWVGPVIEVRDVQKAAPDRLRQGDKFTAAAKFLGQRFETPCEVTDYLSNRQFSFRSTGGPVPQEFTYILEPTLEGTHLTQSVEAQPGAFFRLTGPLFEAAGRRQINSDLETLKDLLEARG